MSLAAQSSAPGTVAGTVVDDRSERPVAGVLVYADAQSSVTTTDSDGRFVLSVPRGRRTITASVIGYALLQAEVEVADAPVELMMRLLEGAGVLNERVTVAGSLREQSDPVAGAMSLHGRELDNLRGAVLDDPLRAMQILPSTTATDDFYSEFAVRGNAFRHIGLVVDGIPARFLMHALNGVVDGGSVTMINSETLSSVTLLPGSYPQRAGRRIGAELDLTTREGRRDSFHGRAGVSGSSATFLGEGPVADGRGSWLISLRRSYLGYVISRLDPGAGFGFGYIDAQSKIVYDVNPRHQLTAAMVIGRATFEEGDPNIGDDEVKSAVSRAWLASMSWRYLAGPRFAITQRLYSTGLRYNNLNRAGATLATAAFADLGWRADAMFSAAGRVIVEFGGDVQRLGARGAQYNEHAGAASAYGQVRFGAGTRGSLSAGSRIDYWKLTDTTAASPWIGAELKLAARTRLVAGSGLYRQFPDLDDVYGTHRGGRSLRAPHGLHFDAGLEHMLTQQTRLMLNAYVRREEDMLWTAGEPRRSPSRGIISGAVDAPLVNALNGTARGVEFVVRREATDAFSGWAGYGYGRLRYTDSLTGEQFWADADQRHTLTAYGSHRLSSRANLSAKYRYGSNYPRIGYIGEPPPALGVRPVVDGRPLFYGLTGQRNTLRLPGYSRLDLRADRSFTWSTRRLVLFVEVANVLNRTNLRNASYRIDRAGRVFDSTESLMPLLPSGGVIVEF